MFPPNSFSVLWRLGVNGNRNIDIFQCSKIFHSSGESLFREN